MPRYALDSSRVLQEAANAGSVSLPKVAPEAEAAQTAKAAQDGHGADGALIELCLDGLKGTKTLKEPIAAGKRGFQRKNASILTIRHSMFCLQAAC